MSKDEQQSSRYEPLRDTKPLTLIDSVFSRARGLVNERNYELTLNRARKVASVEEYTARSAFYATVTGFLSVLIGIPILPILVGLLLDRFTEVANTREAFAQIPIDVPSVIEPFIIGLYSFLSSNSVLILSLFGIVILFVVTWVIVFYARIFYPKTVVNEREREIDTYLPFALLYFYGMVEGGRTVQDAFERIKDREESYGEVANEAERLTSRVQTQVDIITALRRQARATPSEEFRQLLRELASTMEQGGDIGSFFEGQLADKLDAQQQAVKQQNGFMELVIQVFTILLVSSSFLVILGFTSAIIGSSVSGLLNIPALIPLLVGLMFGGLFYILFGAIEPPAREPQFSTPPQYRAKIEDVPEKLKGWELASTVEENTISLSTFVDRPYLSFFVTVPITLFYLAAVNPLTAQLIAEPFVTVLWYIFVPLVLLLALYSVLFEIKQRRLRTVRKELHGLLQQVEEANKQGRQVPDAVKDVTENYDSRLSNSLYNQMQITDYVNPQLLRHALETVAIRFEHPRVRRVMQLLSDSFEETGDVTSILEKTNTYLSEIKKVERERRQIANTSAAVIFSVSFICVGILLVLQFLFIDQLSSATADIGSTGALGLGDIPIEKATAVIQYTAFNTQIVSGTLIGQLRTGKLSSSIKYALILGGLTILIFGLAPVFL